MSLTSVTLSILHVGYRNAVCRCHPSTSTSNTTRKVSSSTQHGQIGLTITRMQLSTIALSSAYHQSHVIHCCRDNVPLKSYPLLSQRVHISDPNILTASLQLLDAVKFQFPHAKDKPASETSIRGSPWSLVEKNQRRILKREDEHDLRPVGFAGGDLSSWMQIPLRGDLTSRPPYLTPCSRDLIAVAR